MRTLVEYFFRSVRENGERAFFRELDATLSYDQVAQRVAAATETLAHHGVAPGDRIVAYCDQTMPLAMLYLACGQMGVLAAPISPVFSRAYVKDLVRQAGAVGVFCMPEHAETALAYRIPVFCSQIRGDAAAVEASGAIPLFHQELPRARTLERLEQAAEECDSMDSFLIQPTSGSTGQPKLVLRTFSAFSRYAEFVGDEVRKATGDGPFDMLAVNALTHAFAGHMFTMAMRLGATICVPPGLDAATDLKHVRALDPHVLPMTPRVARSFVKQAQSDETRRESSDDQPGHLFGPRARLLLSAGGKADVTIGRRLRSEGVEICEFYGSSEASLMAVTPYGKWRPEHAGVPVPDVELRFARDGEILVKSPGLFLGYLGDTDFTSLVFNEDMFYKTGDMGEVGEDGFLRILGRKRDLFNTPEGSNIFPERIEIRLESLRAVHQAMLVGDGRPFVTAHIVLRGADRFSSSTDGAIPPEEADIYHRIGGEVARLNEDLEAIERIVAFFLYNKEFDPRSYKSLSAGKVNRARPEFMKIYGERVATLYSNAMAQDSPHLVPPGERRYVARTSVVRS